MAMAEFFWDAKGRLLIDYHEKGKTINSNYFCNGELFEKRSDLAKKQIK